MDYDHISSAHPPRRDRMLYGLRKIAYLINSGISEEDSYFIQCENFESLIQSIYNGKLRLKIESILRHNRCYGNFTKTILEVLEKISLKKLLLTIILT